ncbi:MAG: Nif3-like dinuclear metal center hexameric protein [Bacteroidaceae bacterium]|nr:Nif3-like dinuclear metal center hexameric protein [Bacteroidaceae bacterium]MBR3717379.1 Nif3-like dinuclear metal center hexameric protein [Bacteroidaceae bacterium]
MKIKEIVDALERFAPLPLQDGFDNAGMQVGLTDADCAGALLCLDVTEEVLDEAISLGCNLVVSHHPLIFKGIKSLTGDNYVERCVMKAVKHDITIFSAHTNLDNAVNGVNFKMAEKIGLTHVEVLDPRADGWLNAGAGVVGELPEPEAEEAFLRRIKQTFEVGCVKHTALTGRQIRRVALCGGAGAFLMPEAIKKGADVFITGEIKYHDYFGRAEEILLAEIGHYESEQYTKEIFKKIISEQFPEVRVMMTSVNTNPINYL